MSASLVKVKCSNTSCRLANSLRFIGRPSCTARLERLSRVRCSNLPRADLNRRDQLFEYCWRIMTGKRLTERASEGQRSSCLSRRALGPTTRRPTLFAAVSAGVRVALTFDIEEFCNVRELRSGCCRELGERSVELLL